MPPTSTFFAATELRIKALTFKAALGLPERVQRALAGKRVTLDGQTLATDTQLMLRLEKAVREPEIATLPVPDGRRALLLQTVIAGGDQPIGAVRELPVGDLRARLYVPTRATARSPLLVYFHGGGWVYGDLDSHDPVCRFLSERSGVRVLSVDYRLAPEHPFPAAYEDALAAYRWVVEHASSLGADPARLGVGGDSAGGNMAAVVSQMAVAGGGAQPAMQLLFYPVTDSAEDTRSRLLFAEGFILTKADMDAFETAYLPPGVDASDQRISILKCPDLAGLPTAYVATAGFDPLRDEGEAYALRMRDCGVRVALRRHSGLIHSFANETAVSPTARAAMLDAAGALRMGLAAPA